MIEIIENLPGSVVGARASGHVTASDYETVLVPAIENAIKSHGSIRLLYHLGPAFENYSPGAMWDDMKIGFSHLQAWERLALVTDHEWLAGGTRLFSFAMPCPVKVFADRDYDDAVKWIASEE